MIQIRKATLKDIPVIAEFQIKMAFETERLTLKPETVSGGVTAVFDKPCMGQYYVAVSSNKVIASLLITYEWSDWRNTEVWWFQSVYVDPQFRRTGVFTEMYGYVKAEAEKHGAAGLRLYVDARNAAAQKTYESAGMTSGHYLLYEWLKEG